MDSPYHWGFQTSPLPGPRRFCHGGGRNGLASVIARVAPPPVLVGLALAAGLGGGLVLTNPDEGEFERFAADQVTRAAEEALCRGGALPLLAGLVVSDCPRLVASQHSLLGRLAVAASRRRQYGIFSVYHTDLGGFSLLNWTLPRYRAVTLAVAGRFLILHSEEGQAGVSRAEGSP